MNLRSRSASNYVLITFLLLSISATCQTEPQKLSYQAMSDKFFELLKQDRATEGVDYLFSTSPNSKKVQEQAENLKGQFWSLRNMAGPYVSHTLLIETKVAGIFVYQHYLVAYDRHPVSIRIKYYKPGAEWLCYGLQIDTDFSQMIQKQADAALQLDFK